MSGMPVSFHLYDKLDPDSLSTEPGYIGPITDLIGKSARVTKRGRGGWWTIQADWQGADWESEEFFMDGLLREVRMIVGGEELFRGFVGQMRLTRANGEIYQRDWTTIYNKWKAIYTRIGDNQLTNGSAESGAWTAYGTPTTNAQSTTWVTDGVYSNYTVANGIGDGATIQSGITIVANKGYQARISVNIVSGSWTFEIYRTDSGVALASRTEDGTGEFVLAVSISEQNTYAGTIGLRYYLVDDASGSIYGDGAVFQDAPFRAETAWYEDTASQSEFGVKEEVLLLPGAADETARARARTELRKAAWAHTFPPDSYSLNTNQGTKLQLVIFGYVMTLNNKHALATGTDAISDHMSALISASEFVEAGVIESNTVEYQIDTQAPLKIWDIIEDMTLSGNASGDRYECGVLAERKFSYETIAATPIYKQRGGRIYELDGSLAEPWRVTPGYVELEDMPLGPEQVSGYETDNPRVVYMFEVTFDLADWLAGGSGLRWRRDRDG